MQVKSEVFSRFGSSVDFFSGEPLSGVGAPTVGADLCVRPSSPERSLFCVSARPHRSAVCSVGRTRRSAPTQTTSTRKVQPSDSVTPVFVETHEPCVPTKDYTSLFDTTDALLLSERSYTLLHVLCDSHVEKPKSPRGYFSFSTWGRFDSSEVSFDSSEVLFLVHVENFLFPRGDLRFPT